MSADEERGAAKKQKRGSNGKGAAAGGATSAQVAGGSSADVLQPPEEETVPAPVDAAPNVAAKKAPARKKAVKTKPDTAEAAPVETGAAAKAGKRPEKASRKRNLEGGTSAAAGEDGKTGAQQVDESAADAAPGGRRARPARARTSSAPYWMGGAVEDDSAVIKYELLGAETPATAGSDDEWEAAARPKQASKRHKSASDVAQPAAVDAAEPTRARKKTAGNVQAEDVSGVAAERAADTAEDEAKPKRARKTAAEDTAEAAEVSDKPKRGRKTSAEALQEEEIQVTSGEAAGAAAKPKRRHKKSVEDVHAEESPVEEDAPETAAEELPGKPAAAGKGRGKLVRAGRMEAVLEDGAAVADQQEEAAEPPAKKAGQQKKAKVNKADEAATHQPDDMDVAGSSTPYSTCEPAHTVVLHIPTSVCPYRQFQVVDLFRHCNLLTLAIPFLKHVSCDSGCWRQQWHGDGRRGAA